jgi:nitrogen fixation NifU-like protein
LYKPEMRDHFDHPRHAGEVANPDASVMMSNPACGDVLQLTLKVTAGRIEAIRYRAQGCVAIIACGSALTELTQGQTLDHARSLQYTEISEALGGLPRASLHASHLVIKAFHAALDQLKP